MAPSNWNEEKITEKLKEMPRVEDHRDKEDIFLAIENKLSRDSDKTEVKKRPFWIFPSLATAAAFVLMVLLLPPLFEDNTGVQPMRDNQANHDGDPSLQMATLKKDEGHYLGVIHKIPEDKEALTLYYPEPGQLFLVPITFLVEASENEQLIRKIQQILSTFEPQMYGLSESYLKGVDIKQGESEEQIIVDIPNDYFEQYGSGPEKLFMDTISYTFSKLGYSEVRFQSNNEEGYEFPHYGLLTGDVLREQNIKGYLPFKTTTGHIVLYNPEINSADIDIDNISEWLQEEAVFVRDPIFTTDFGFKITEVDEDNISIQFNENNMIKNNDESLAIIDSILLTAKTFNYQNVTFIDQPVKQLGPYNLSSEVQVPIAPNYIDVNLLSNERNESADDQSPE